MEILPKIIPEEKVVVIYKKDGADMMPWIGGDYIFIASLNELEFLEFRCQIKKAAATGYCIKHNDTIYPIDKDGRLNCPELFESRQKYLRELLLSKN